MEIEVANIYGIIPILIVGMLAGWIAGFVTKGQGFGLLTNMLLGVIGAFLGGYLFTLFGLSATGFLGFLLIATVGAVVLIVVISLLRKIVR